ncbi:hypothetical protein ACM01_39715 [Streptomyces viridochromogenes]|uniref:Calcium-binding protein n=1 Tax=Streptomyces viridochromogenes TaxID=1938 RepID=A0A0J8BRQ1_STRVR|nr:hypothetical protein [Streptomyces viridochromogenes]KMS68285.1 hypothetical protein ACM01_39715 [Streptomyces viridochromogenes]KOG08768.1 hypothetical protein ADK35_40905 [Streptomyces viridochromogenes]KOG09110.1 hypothetical protein ADK36_41640 [Streptomyces viridochromogenes]
MGKQFWRVVVAGGAAAVFTAVAAAPAGAAEGGVSFTRVQVNDGKPIVIGVSNEVAVPASFRMATTQAWEYPAVYLYRNGGDELWHAIETSDCIKVSSGVCDFDETMYFDPSVWDMRNSEAGAWKVAARVYFKGDGGDTDDEGLTVHVKRNSRLTVNASPEPVAKDKTITVTGKVTRANWETRKYASYGGRLVSLQFKPSGAASYTTVKKVYANSSGDLRTTVKASKTGTWRWVYYGNTTTGPSMSSGDNVVVN